MYTCDVTLRLYNLELWYLLIDDYFLHCKMFVYIDKIAMFDSVMEMRLYIKINLGVSNKNIVMLPLKCKLKWNDANYVLHFHAYPLRLPRPTWRRSEMSRFWYGWILTSLLVSFSGILQLPQCLQSIQGEYRWTNCLVLSGNTVVPEQCDRLAVYLWAYHTVYFWKSYLVTCMT